MAPPARQVLIPQFLGQPARLAQRDLRELRELPAPQARRERLPLLQVPPALPGQLGLRALQEPQALQDLPEREDL